MQGNERGIPRFASRISDGYWLYKTQTSDNTVSGKIVRRGTFVYVHDDYTDDELTQHFKEISKEKLDGVVIPVNSGEKVFIHDDQSIDMAFVNVENVSFDTLENIFPKMKRDFGVILLNCDSDKTFEVINMFCNKYDIWNKTGFSESTLVRLVITDSKPPSPLSPQTD